MWTISNGCDCLSVIIEPDLKKKGKGAGGSWTARNE